MASNTKGPTLGDSHELGRHDLSTLRQAGTKKATQVGSKQSMAQSSQPVESDAVRVRPPTAAEARAARAAALAAGAPPEAAEAAAAAVAAVLSKQHAAAGSDANGKAAGSDANGKVSTSNAKVSESAAAHAKSSSEPPADAALFVMERAGLLEAPQVPTSQVPDKASNNKHSATESNPETWMSQWGAWHTDMAMQANAAALASTAVAEGLLSEAAAAAAPCKAEGTRLEAAVRDAGKVSAVGGERGGGRVEEGPKAAAVRLRRANAAAEQARGRDNRQWPVARGGGGGRGGAKPAAKPPLPAAARKVFAAAPPLAAAHPAAGLKGRHPAEEYEALRGQRGLAAAKAHAQLQQPSPLQQPQPSGRSEYSGPSVTSSKSQASGPPRQAQRHRDVSPGDDTIGGGRGNGGSIDDDGETTEGAAGSLLFGGMDQNTGHGGRSNRGGGGKGAASRAEDEDRATMLRQWQELNQRSSAAKQQRQPAAPLIQPQQTWQQQQPQHLQQPQPWGNGPRPDPTRPEQRYVEVNGVLQGNSEAARVGGGYGYASYAGAGGGHGSDGAGPKGGVLREAEARKRRSKAARQAAAGLYGASAAYGGKVIDKSVRAKPAKPARYAAPAPGANGRAAPGPYPFQQPLQLPLNQQQQPPQYQPQLWQQQQQQQQQQEHQIYPVQPPQFQQQPPYYGQQGQPPYSQQQQQQPYSSYSSQAHQSNMYPGYPRMNPSIPGAPGAGVSNYHANSPGTMPSSSSSLSSGGHSNGVVSQLSGGGGNSEGSGGSSEVGEQQRLRQQAELLAALAEVPAGKRPDLLAALEGIEKKLLGDSLELPVGHLRQLAGLGGAGDAGGGGAHANANAQGPAKMSHNNNKKVGGKVRNSGGGGKNGAGVPAAATKVEVVGAGGRIAKVAKPNGTKKLLERIADALAAASSSASGGNGVGNGVGSIAKVGGGGKGPRMLSGPLARVATEAAKGPKRPLLLLSEKRLLARVHADCGGLRLSPADALLVRAHRHACLPTACILVHHG